MTRAQPTLDAVGKKVLERLPVWSFTWRFLYQSLPLTADTYVQNAWRPFVDQQVIPILKEHLDDFFGIFKDVIAAATKNPNVGGAGGQLRLELGIGAREGLVAVLIRLETLLERGEPIVAQ